MNTKSISLAIAATVLAGGSVFATFTQESPYAWIRFSGEANPEYQVLGGSCEDSGNWACRIRINGVEYQAFKAGCVTPLKSANGHTVTLTNPNIVEVYNTPL